VDGQQAGQEGGPGNEQSRSQRVPAEERGAPFHQEWVERWGEERGGKGIVAAFGNGLVLRRVPALPGFQPGIGFQRGPLVQVRDQAGRGGRKNLPHAPHPHSEQEARGQEYQQYSKNRFLSGLMHVSIL